MAVGQPTFKQLQYFHAICMAKSFRKAAQRLGVSQPTITAQISALEDALGLILLERSRTGAFPTAAGRAILPHAERTMEEVHAIRDIARFSLDSASGIHRLGVPSTLGPYFLPDVISDIHSEYPSLRLYVREEPPRDLENGLLDGRYDLILTTRPLEVTGITEDLLFGEPFVLCAPPDHPLAAKGKVEPEDIAGERLLAIEERHRLFTQMQAIANRYGARLMRDYEGTSLDTVRQMIGTGIGLAFLPALYVRSEIGPRHDVEVLELDETPTDREVVLAWRPSAPQRQLYRAMAAFLRVQCRKKLGRILHVAEG